MVKAVRRWSNTNKPILNKASATINNNGDSGFNESTDTNVIVTPPNGKINFESEKTTISIMKKNVSNRNQVVPEVTIK